MKFIKIMMMLRVVMLILSAALSSMTFADELDHSNAGYIDGVSLNPDNMTYTVSGWACAKNYTGSIAVDLYFGGPYGVGIGYGRFQANQSSEEGIAVACSSSGSNYRFHILIDNSTAKAQVGKGIFIHGINPWNGQNGITNSLIGNSGNVSLPALPVAVAQPKVLGYIDSAQKQADGSVVVSGWACVSTDNSFIQVDLYAGGPFGVGTALGRFSASLSSEAGIAAACSASGSNYRFSIPVSASDAIKYSGQSIWIHGIDPLDATGASNLVISNSGNLSFPLIELFRDPLANEGVTPFISTLSADEMSICKSNWIAAGKLNALAPWNLVEIAENTYFCNNPGNASPNVSGQPLSYSSIDSSKSLLMNPGGTITDPEPTIDFSFDTSKEWREGCNLGIPDINGNNPKYGGSGWNWPHFLMEQDIQNPEVLGTPLDLTQFSKITLVASINVVSSEKIPSVYDDSQGNCPIGTWASGQYFTNHEIFYINAVLRKKSDNSQIYVLVPVFNSENGIDGIQQINEWIGAKGSDPKAGGLDDTYYAPALPFVSKAGTGWVNFSVDVQDITGKGIAAYNRVYGTNYQKSDYTLSSFLMGFEVWGAYKTKVQVKNLSLSVAAPVSTPVSKEPVVTAAPICTSVSLMPSSLPATGGTVSAQANCSGSGLAYSWIVNDAVYIGDQSTNSSPVSPNTTTSPKTYMVCVTASNTGGQSQAVCAPITEAAMVTAAPVCASVSLTPSSLPATGGTVLAQANCSGSGLIYTWTVNGMTYPGNLAINSSPVNPNPTTSSENYTLCVTASNAGGNSQQVCTSLIEAGVSSAAPTMPTIGSAIAGNGTVSVSFTPGALGSGTLVNYTISCNGVTATGNASPITVTGLQNGTAYSCQVKTTSSVGTSGWSAVSNTVVPLALSTPPSAPTIGTSTAGNGTATISFTPGALGSGTLVNYTISCNGMTATGNASPITVTGLQNGTAYSCQVKTTSSVGTSGWSAVSNTVVPLAPSTPPSTPTIGTATADNGTATVSFTPGALGSGTLVNYTINCNGVTATGNVSPITVTGLQNGVTYSCQVKTTSSVGTSGWSALSNPIAVSTLPAAPAAPVCAFLTLTPTSLPSSGGSVSGVANCTGSGLTYAWTINDATYPGTGATNSGAIAANTGTSSIVDKVCVTATNTAGKSSACAQVTEAGVAPLTAPNCAAPTLTPNSLPANGGNVAAQANCSGGNLTYTWSINSVAYPGNQATNSSPVGPNAGPGAAFYAVCVQATNSVGQSSNCAQLVEASPASIAPVCSSLSLTPNNLPATGGNVTAQATCTHSGSGIIYYTWTVNGQPFPAAGPSAVTYQPTNSLAMAANTTATPLSYTVCVTANDSNGQSQQTCAPTPLVEAGAATVLPSAPTIGTATPIGNGAVSVSFTPGPSGTGTLVNYTVNCGTYPVTGSSSPIIVNLGSGAYLCKASTTTTAGTSPWSDYTDPVFLQ